jgi:hypothetical protein
LTSLPQGVILPFRQLMAARPGGRGEQEHVLL